MHGEGSEFFFGRGTEKQLKYERDLFWGCLMKLRKHTKEADGAATNEASERTVAKPRSSQSYLHKC